MMRLPSFAVLALVLAACGSEVDVDVDVGDSTATAGLGAALSTENCTEVEIAQLREALNLARWVGQTPEYGQCLHDGFALSTIRYEPQPLDLPTPAGAAEEDYALAAVRASNPILVRCIDSGDSQTLNPVSTWAFGFVGQERFAFRRSAVAAEKGSLAGLFVHESMHVHNYHHGFDNSPHSMNSVAGNCMAESISNGNSSVATKRVRNAGIAASPMFYIRMLIAAVLNGTINSDVSMTSGVISLTLKRKIVPQHNPGKCLQPRGTRFQDWQAIGQTIVQGPCPTGASLLAKWVALPLPGATPAGLPLRYHLMNVLSGHCLDRPNGSTVSGTILQQYTCHGGRSERFIQRSTGQWEAVGADGLGSGTCLDVPSFNTADNIALQMSTCKSSNMANQVFTMPL